MQPQERTRVTVPQSSRPPVVMPGGAVVHHIMRGAVHELPKTLQATIHDPFVADVPSGTAGDEQDRRTAKPVRSC